MAEFELIADGLRFPEAPVVMDDGSVIVVEIEAGRITRCWPGGRKEVVATPGGGPNGLAIGPDGKLYCCNNGGFNYVESNGYLAPHGIADDYSGGRIERIDIETGEVEMLYRTGDHGVTLRGAGMDGESASVLDLTGQQGAGEGCWSRPTTSPCAISRSRTPRATGSSPRARTTSSITASAWNGPAGRRKPTAPMASIRSKAPACW